jgi:DOPA 4,5-dioxygenase
MDPKPVSDIYSYHAHIYFDGPEQRETAMAVRAAIEARFTVQMGRVHDRLIAPMPGRCTRWRLVLRSFLVSCLG